MKVASIKFHTNAILLFAFITLLSLLIVKGYIYTYLLTNFSVRTYISCDIGGQSCFTTDDKDYYAYATMNGTDYKRCGAEDSCDEFCALPGNCKIEFCSSDVSSSDEWCSASTSVSDQLTNNAIDSGDTGSSTGSI
jgi:hypothetical protein